MLRLWIHRVHLSFEDQLEREIAADLSKSDRPFRVKHVLFGNGLTVQHITGQDLLQNRSTSTTSSIEHLTRTRLESLAVCAISADMLTTKELLKLVPKAVQKAAVPQNERVVVVPN
eukprot:SAG31_NODE_16290_length_715_cov_0.831169_1_plen_115_part_10